MTRGIRWRWVIWVNSTISIVRKNAPRSVKLYSRLQIEWYRILRSFLKTFDSVPRVPRFSWDLSLVPCHYLSLISNTVGRFLVCWIFFRNNLKILCHPLCNQLFISIGILFWRSLRRSHDWFLRQKIERFFWRDFSGEEFREQHYCPTTLFPLIGCGVDSFSPN